MAQVAEKELVNSNRPDFLDSVMVRLRTSGVTIDAATVQQGTDGRKRLKAGQVVGAGTNGKYKACTYNADSQTWEPAPKGLLMDDVDVTDGDAEAAIMDWGRVKPKALPFYDGLGDNKDTAMNKLAKALPGITFVGYELTIS